MLRLILHGGAGRIDEDRRPSYRAGLRAALDAGWAVLEAGGDAAAGAHPGDAIARALGDLGAMDGYGGLITLDRDGRLAYGFDTSAMAVAWRAHDARGLREEIEVHLEAGVRLPLADQSGLLPADAG